MLLLILLAVVLVCALLPAVMFCINLRLYRVPPQASGTGDVAVLIPARNEEAHIEACVRSVLASTGVSLRVLVMDDASTDRTPQVVQALMAADPRVSLLHAPPLPSGWNGKQHACWHLARAAEAPRLLFLDADVRLAPEAITRMSAFQQQSRAALVSGFPRQITVTWLEWLLLPLIHFVLLGLLPMRGMRKTTRPAYAAGCGQFLLVERDAYFVSGGHAAIRETMHDGLRLPKLMRSHGLRTDLADLTKLAEVRMYHSASEVWNGLSKNATEGLAAPARILPVTLLLLFGQVAPLLIVPAVLCRLFLVWGFGPRGTVEFAAFASMAAMLSVCAVFLPRLLSAARFRQPLKSALLHPLGIVALLGVQWYALFRQFAGKPIGWRARLYTSGSGAEIR